MTELNKEVIKIKYVCESKDGNKNGKCKYKNVTIVGSWLFHIDQLKIQKLNVINSFQEVINWFNQMGSKVNIIYDIPTFKGTWPCKYNFRKFQWDAQKTIDYSVAARQMQKQDDIFKKFQ